MVSDPGAPVETVRQSKERANKCRGTIIPVEIPEGQRVRDVRKRLGLEEGGWPCEESGVNTAETTCWRGRRARVAREVCVVGWHGQWPGG